MAIRLEKKDVHFVSLKTVGIDSREAKKAFEWINQMNEGEDGEDGPDFEKWIRYHFTESRSLPQFDTFFLFDRAPTRSSWN
jgi:hypothetical protein